jgi:hypothetical protein
MNHCQGRFEVSSAGKTEEKNVLFIFLAGGISPSYPALCSFNAYCKM